MDEIRVRRRRVILLILAVLVLALMIGAWYMQQLIYSGSAEGEAVEVQIAAGSSIAEIATLLAEQGIIDHPLLFQFYANSSGQAAQLQAGAYSFTKGQSIAGVIENMASGNILRDRFKFVIPEGSNIMQIAAGAERQGFCEAEEFLQAVRESSLHVQQPGVIYALEGYLYPATYTFDTKPTPEELLETFYDQAQMIYADLEIPEDYPLNLEEIIILASVLEKESQHDDERAKVAGVFLNRLEIEMPLQSCASVQYILPEFKAVLSDEDTLIDSPYNTYVNPGLPVGPISSPSLMALEAVLNPAETDYLFFVADEDGKHIFTRSYEEHLAAIASIEP